MIAAAPRSIIFYPVEELHAQNAGRRILAVDLGKDDVRHVGEVGGECLGVLRLDPHLDLADGVLAELVDDGLGLISGDDVLEETRGRAQQGRIAIDELPDPRLHHLEDDILTRPQPGSVALRDGGRSERELVDGGEDVFDRSAEIVLDHLADFIEIHRR
jgi:hypothetical protein